VPDKLIEMNGDDIRQAYARWAPVYDVTFGKIANAGRLAAVEQINKTSGTVLEVGVGTGISLPHYQDHLEVTGIDLSLDMMAIARKRVEQEKLSHVVAIEEMDAGEMSFEDNSFQTVVAMYVMTVVPDPAKVMHELSRVCKPGGEVIVVNHFSQPHGVRGLVEKAMARFGDKLGWRPEFPMGSILVCDDLQIVDSVALKPFGLFTLMRFRKLAKSDAGKAGKEDESLPSSSGQQVA